MAEVEQTMNLTTGRAFNTLINTVGEASWVKPFYFDYDRYGFPYKAIKADFEDDLDIRENPIGERDMTVLRVIEEERLTVFTFGGLKRRLRIHPETLSRVLNRLEGQGIVEKSPEGYKVKTKSKENISLHSLNLEEMHVSLLQTLLPQDIPIQHIISDLKGRWFGVLRWLGYSENYDGITLKWVTDDGGIQVDAHFSNNGLNIDAKLFEEKNLSETIKASYDLIGYIKRLYSRKGLARRVFYFEALDPNILLA